jgi:hypothetical protein
MVSSDAVDVGPKGENINFFTPSPLGRFHSNGDKVSFLVEYTQVSPLARPCSIFQVLAC